MDSDPLSLARAVEKRRTFAIISHPDAGKTTLTEKLLLYGGAINTAGQVAARRRARSATSDWMELERERGISITSTVLQFPYQRPHDQPARHARPPRFRRGHVPHAAGRRQRRHADRRRQRRRAADEKAVRDLPRAPDSALHVHQQDGPAQPRPARAARRTREGARHRDVPDQLADRERTGVPGRVRPPHARGAYLRAHRTRRETRARPRYRSRRSQLRGPDRRSDVPRVPRRPRIARRRRYVVRRRGASCRGDATPVFFGSAVTNFGVELFLDGFLQMAPPPRARLALRAGGDQPRARAAGLGPLLRLRVQDSSEHGSAPPRPGRVPARLQR